MSGYVELHAHSAYSFLDGASLPEELAFQAHKLGMKALALTDHNGLYGSMEFAHAAKAWGVQPITGAEVRLEGGSHLTLLAESQRGYANLCRLLSEAHLGRPKGEAQVSMESLERHHAGLIALSGCRQGEIARLLDAGRADEALAAARRYREIFGPSHFFIELQQNLARGDTPRIKGLAALARRLELGVAATNNVHYHVRRRSRLQDVMVAIAHRSTLDASHRLRRPNGEFYLKPAQEMERLFAELPQALRATEAIAERCSDFDLTADLGYAFPDFQRDRREGERAEQALERVCREALEERYAGDPALRRRARERLEQELELVRRHGLCGFFLVYRDLMHLAEEVAQEARGPSPARRAARLPPGRGRGSSVSSLICYLIGLSHVDPVQNGLAIDRFLNDAMGSVPDIDLDFSRDIRAALIERVYAHYGWEHAALVCSFSTYRLRSAVRDVGKALGLPALELDRLAKMAGGRDGEDVESTLNALPEFAGRSQAPLWRHLIELVKEIAGFPRHISQHVGGMVISSRPLVECVPVEPARMAGRYVCQWDKDSCDDARMIKIDFLALGMLSLVEECVEHIAASEGKLLDISRIPFDDGAVYDQIGRGDTLGVFQIESRAQMQLLPRTKPRNLDELAIEVAIVRPGPIVGGAVHPYVTRRMAKREAERRGEPYEPPYEHELLKPALEETLGVILYQDQVLQVAMRLAGFTTGQAEQLRRALGRKRSKEAIKALQERFMAGAAAKGVPAETAEKVFLQILAFSEFGFPKSHAYAFAVLAYQSAWLRCHHPAPYAAALLNSQPMGFYPPRAVVRDVQRHGVEVLPPDINRSDAICRVEGKGVRIGLNYIKGLGKAEAEQIVEERSRRGPYRSLDDFARRLPLPLRQLERLAASGAFDSFGKGRRELLWSLRLTHRPRAIGHERMADGTKRTRLQMPLPIEAGEAPAGLPRMNLFDTVAADYAATGLSTRKHPLALLRPQLPRRLRTIAEVENAREGVRLLAAGMVVARQRPETAKGVLFVLIEDETGLLNVVVRPDLYDRQRAVLRGEAMLAFSGRVQKRDGTLSLLAEEVWALEDLPGAQRARKLSGVAKDSYDFR